MASCGEHTMAVTAAGRAWTCGLNFFVQLGVGNRASRLEFMLVDAGQLGGASLSLSLSLSLTLSRSSQSLSPTPSPKPPPSLGPSSTCLSVCCQRQGEMRYPDTNSPTCVSPQYMACSHTHNTNDYGQYTH